MTMQDPQPPKQVIVYSAFLALAISVVTLSAVGPTFLYLEARQHITPLLAACWRCQAMVIFLLIPAFLEKKFSTEANEKQSIAYSSIPTSEIGGIDDDEDDSQILDEDSSHETKTTHRNFNEDERSHYRFPLPVQVVGTAITWAISLALWVVALQFTTTAWASLFGSTYPLIILAYLRLTGVQISSLESYGVMITVCGMALSEFLALEHPQQSEPNHTPTSWLLTSNVTSAASAQDPSETLTYVIRNESQKFLGDMLCVGSSIFSAINILTATETRKRMNLFEYTFWCSCVATTSLAIFTIVYEGSSIGTDRDGLFGWIFDRQLFWIISVFGFTVGMIGLLGYNFALRYVHPLLFSVIQLLDPSLTAVMSWLAHLEPIPGLNTLIGVICITGGIVLVVIGEYGRKNQEAAYNNPSKPTVKGIAEL